MKEFVAFGLLLAAMFFIRWLFDFEAAVILALALIYGKVYHYE